ncbi:MAG: GYF domain-containing protein [Vicinamibacterales bacterium]
MDAPYFLIGTDGRQHGPLSQDDVRTWLADGRASRYSRARRDADNQWIALREMPEFEEETRPPHLGGNAVPPSDDGTSRTPPMPARPTTLDPVSCLRRGFQLVTSDFIGLAVPTLTATLLIGLITQIPRAAVIVGAIVNNVLMCGVLLLFLGAIRGRRPTFDELLPPLVQAAPRIILAGLVQSLVSAPLVLALVAANSSRSPLALAAACILLVPTMYLLVGYVFMMPLMVDRRLSIWSAMEASRRAVHGAWFPTFGLLLASGMLLMLSAILIGIPLIITLPVCAAALMFAYSDLFDANR